MNHKTKSIFFSAIIGNILEYYDFTVYIVCMSKIGHTFFPSELEFQEVFLALAGFAVGFIFRPVGGIVFGYIGDRYGRRISLIISMLGMTIPTFTIGLIPSYNEIGFYAPLVLVIMRLIQGLCISGEGAGAAIFILEHHRNLPPGFTAGLVHGSNITGTLVAAFIGIIIDKYFYDIDFAWRFTFLIGGFMGMVGFYLRLMVSETPVFEMLAHKRKNSKTSFINVIKTAWKSMFVTFCVGATASSMLYLVKSYVPVLIKNIKHSSGASATTLAYYSYSIFIAMIAMPIAGGISDFIGKFRMIVLSSILIFILSIPALLLSNSTCILQQMIGLTIVGIIGGAISGTAYIFIISLFKPEQRFLGVGFSYNLAIAIFGGTSGMISQWLVSRTNVAWSPALYVMATSGIFLIILFFMRNVIKSLINE